MSVQSRLWAGLALLTATLAVVISVALTLPVTGWRFQATTEALLASQADQKNQTWSRPTLTTTC